MKGPSTRRSFLSAGAAASLLPLAGFGMRTAGEETGQATLTAFPERILGRTPDNFLGFGYEISAVAEPGLLAPGNTKLIQLYRQLGREGVVRIGGNTSDFSTYKADGDAISAPKATVANRKSIDDLGQFLQATGWQLIWGLNLGSNDVHNAVEEATAVVKAAGDRLLCFQIGNEPDLFPHSEHRPANYGYPEFLQEFTRFASVLRQRFPTMPLAGPDAAFTTSWVTSFAGDQGRNVKLLTEHYYRAGQKQPAATFDNLLRTDARFVDMVSQLRTVSKHFGIPYRLVELNSFSGGGKPGVSDTFASALWALDLMFTLASADGAGINIESGVNQLGFVSSYSPIFNDGPENLTARPSYYAMLAFSLSGIGRRVDALLAAPGLNLTAYGTLNDNGKLWLTLINKNISHRVRVSVRCPTNFRPSKQMSLTAPAYDSKNGVTLGGSEISADGHWKGSDLSAPACINGSMVLSMPAASALLIEMSS